MASFDQCCERLKSNEKHFYLFFIKFMVYDFYEGLMNFIIQLTYGLDNLMEIPSLP